ncbi:MAG: competence/damage-inducible protein A [Balneolales bacterium]
MTAHIITIGTELLIGDTLNTNASWMGSLLTENGLKCEKAITVGDEPDQILSVLDQSLKQADLTVMTGGLGPTHDDITKKSLLAYFNVKMRRHEPTLQHVQEYFKKRSLPFSKSNYDQADVPENCEVMHNAMGTAPGMWFPEYNLAVLPGVPPEMKYLMNQEVVPRIKKLFPGTEDSYVRYFQLTGIGESTLNDLNLDGLSAYLSKNITLAFLPHASGMTLRINSREQDGEQVRKLEDYLRQKAGEYIYSEQKDEKLNLVVGRLLSEKKLTLSTAESCTGGFLANTVTDVPGSSAWFTGGILPYSNTMKINLLDVDKKMLEEYGAVSKQVALQMARSAARTLGSHLAVSTTGIAGPGGGSEAKPVGTVWVGYWSEQDHFAVKLNLFRDRLINKERTSVIALDLIRRRLLGISTLPYGLKPEYSRAPYKL